MKKTIRLTALLLALAMVLCSCGGKRSFSDGLDENGYFKGVKAADYFDIEGMDDVKLSMAEIEEEIQYLINDEFPDEIQITDRAITATDTVNIDYVGSVDGVEFEGGSTGGNGTNVTIGVTSYIDNFLEQLIGHKPGDEFDINVTFPDPYENNPDLAGKPAVFRTKVNYVVEHTPAEFNDEFVEKNLYYYFYYYYRTSVKTVEEYYEVMKQLQIQNYILDHCVFSEGKEIPESVQKTVNDETILELTVRAERQSGVELITYLKDNYDVDSEAAFLEKYADSLKSQAESDMLVQALAEYYGIKVTEDDVKEFFTSEDEEAEDPEEAFKTLMEVYTMNYLKKNVLNYKVIDHVTEIATFE